MEVILGYEQYTPAYGSMLLKLATSTGTSAVDSLGDIRLDTFLVNQKHRPGDRHWDSRPTLRASGIEPSPAPSSSSEWHSEERRANVTTEQLVNVVLQSWQLTAKAVAASPSEFLGRDQGDARVPPIEEGDRNRLD